HYPVGVASALVDVLAHYGYKRGILVYSPPGVGKTTLLRDLARTLTRAPHYLRLCLIDPRGELDFPDTANLPLLIYTKPILRELQYLLPFAPCPLK
ncbi:MAG: hypothetical protein J6R60_03180, partial [Clostridia bacterium]|nr:hypothetical protein [Clostridia bacterium]